MTSNKSIKIIVRIFDKLLIATVLVSLVLGLFTSPGYATSTRSADIPTDPPYEGEPTTAFQIELAAAISQRQAEGFPVPEITFNTTAVQPERSSPFGMLQADSLAGETTTTKATTFIYFNGPQEAGYDEWPDLEISGYLGGDKANSFTTGNLNEVVLTELEKQDPDFWNEAEFGQAPREYTFTETIEITPGPELLPTELSLMNSLQANSPETLQLDPALPTTTEDILMGFTYTGPGIKYVIEKRIKVFGIELAYVRAGFVLDWALGLRLPAEVTLSQVEGAGPAFETSLVPEDWSVADYTAYGVAPEPNTEDGTDGNEFVFRIEFFAGVTVRVFGLGPTYGIDFNKDFSQTFETPFGENDPFSIGSFTIPLITLPNSDDDDDDDDNNGGDDTDYSDIFEISIGLEIEPQFSSNKIKADWSADAGPSCSEQGTVEYNPTTATPINLTDACFSVTTNPIQLKVDNFRYYFNQFSFGFGLAVSVTVFKFIEIAPPLDPLFTLKLNDIFPKLSDVEFLHVGDHMQCNYLFKCDRAGPDNIVALGGYTPPPDTTPPIITPIITGILGDNGWYTSDVTLTWEIVDIQSEITDKNGCEPVEIQSDQLDTSYTCEAASEGGLDAVTVTIKRDATPPSLICPAAGPFLLNSGEHEIGPVDVDASISGLNADLSILDALVTTGNAGPQIFDFSAKDMAGNGTDINCRYDVDYNFSGFLPPVKAMNAGKAGRTIPIKWQLTDTNGAYIGDTSAVTSISVQTSNMCSISETELTTIEMYTDVADWRYDSKDNQFIFNWRTPTTPGCYAIELTLDSNQILVAIFELK